MKFGCSVCGCHFADEFEKTVTAPCNFWGEIGMSAVPVEYKKKIFDTIMSLPFDEMNLKFNLSMSFSFSAKPLIKDQDMRFEDMVEGWKDMKDEERRDFQRNYFKAQRQKSKEKPVQDIIIEVQEPVTAHKKAGKVKKHLVN